MKILSVGAGTGDDLETLNKFGKVYVIDIDKKCIDMIDKKSCEEKKIADICKIPYKKESFDVVISTDVFEHIKNDKKAVSEVYRVLKNNGLLIFTVPAFQILFSSHDVALGHQRRYSKKQLNTLFNEFSVQKITYWNFFLFPAVALWRFLNKNTKPRVDNSTVSKSLNKILYAVLKFENILIKIGINLPFGLSLAGYCKK